MLSRNFTQKYTKNFFFKKRNPSLNCQLYANDSSFLLKVFNFF